jgi:hypothetical protein
MRNGTANQIKIKEVALLTKLPYTEEYPVRKVVTDEWEIKVYERYVMMDRKGFEELLRRGRFFGLYSKVLGEE